MAKKLIMAAMSIAAMAAFIVPAAANAAVVEFASGGAVPINTEITGTANNTTIKLVTQTDLGQLECSSIMLGGTLKVNSGGNVEGSGTEAQSTTSGCSFEGEPAEVTGINLKKISALSTETTGTGKFEATYRSKIPGGVECKFATGTPGVFHYEVGSDIITVTPTTVTGSGCGTSTLEGQVTLEARTSGGVIDPIVLK